MKGNVYIVDCRQYLHNLELALQNIDKHLLKKVLVKFFKASAATLSFY